MRKKFFVLLISIVSILNISIVTNYAYVILNDGLAPESIGDFTVVSTDDAYEESKNTFTDKVNKYYLLTQDNEKSNMKFIMYRGKEYAVDGVVVVPEKFDFKSLKYNTDFIFSFNNTIFFDEGMYWDIDSSNNKLFSISNLSIIGLGENNGEPTTIITKDTRTGNPEYEDRMGRFNFEVTSNIYIENLIFDGREKDMYPVGGITGVPKNFGEYFFHIGRGTDGFFMKDIILQNIGSTNIEYSNENKKKKNIAIGITENSGQINLENITIRNSKTTEDNGIISVDQGKNIFFKNINIIGDNKYNKNSLSIKIGHSAVNIVKIAENSTVFSGDIKLPHEESHNYIYVQDYRYKYIKVPSSFKYSNWRTTNGNEKKEAFIILKEKPVSDTYHGTMDLRDNYWVIDDNPLTTVRIQLDSIKKIINYGKEKVPGGKVKLINSDEINSFEIPKLDNINVNLVAVNSENSLYTERNILPIIKDINIKNPYGCYVNYYNFDFHNNNFYTMKEIIEGIGNKPALIEKSSEDNFINCKFTVLAKKLNILDKPSILELGKELEIKGIIDLGYTLKDIDGNKVDDKDIKWQSSNTDIATIDENGKILGKNTGIVRITGIAKDKYNDGEIEKPLDYFDLEIIENSINIENYNGIYDGKYHSIVIDGIKEEDKIYYSIDNGVKWVEEKYEFKDVGEYSLKIKIENPNKEDKILEGKIIIGKAPIEIVVENSSKNYGEKDPLFKGNIKGLISGEVFNIIYKRTNSNENIGNYKGVLDVEFEDNPNYDIIVIRGDFEIISPMNLPNTGGKGTKNYMHLGLLVMISSIYILKKTNKRYL